MGNSIAADVLTFIPIFQPMARAREKPPPAQPAPARAQAAFEDCCWILADSNIPGEVEGCLARRK